ncbi:MAG: vWA domain-containing protein [Hyphomicrobium sp.]
MPRNLLPLGLRLLLIAVYSGAGAAIMQAADEAPTAVILLDGSGSMWGRMGGDKRPKFDVARDVLNKALPSIKPEVRLGLASFGHRRKSNCRDAQVIVPPAAGNLEQVIEPLNRLSATGKGPLVLGLLEAAEAVGNSAPANIILIHDDVDNCGQNVCMVARAIASANPKLAVHVVSIGLEKSKLNAMQCLPKVTGGKHYNVPDTKGLTSALNQIIKLANLEKRVEATMAGKTAPGAPSTAPAAKDGPGLYATATLKPNGEPLQSPVEWRVTKAGEDGDSIREATAPGLTEKLPPGTYDVEAKLGLATVRQPVEVKADAPTPARINLNAGVLKMLARPARNARPLAGPVFTVTAANTASKDKMRAPIWLGRQSKPEIVLPAGDYVVRAQDGPAYQEKTVKVAPGAGTTFDAALATGRLQLFATRERNSGKPMSEGVTFLVYEDDPYSPLGRKEVARSAAPSPTFTLPAGTYYITARIAAAEAHEQIAIGAGDVVKRILQLGLSRVKLSATLDGAAPPANMPLVFKVVRLDGSEREVAHTVANNPEFDLSPGRYRLEAHLGAMNVKANREVTLAAAQSQDVKLKLEAGRVTLKLAGDHSGFGTGDVFWEIKDGNQHTVLRTSRPQPTVLLAPGYYVVESEARDQKSRTAFELKAGDNRTLKVGQQ